jgi:hypothetical protein
LQGFASPDLINTAQFLLAAAEKDKDWQQNDWLTKFALTGDIVCSVQDLSGLQNDILENGEVVRQVWEDGRDRSVMPNPRVFVVDPIDQSGFEYFFAEEALALKYKILYHYSRNKIHYNREKIVQGERRTKPKMFSCRLTDEPLADWKYAEAEVLPASLLSDLKGNTNYRSSDGPAPREGRFRAPKLSSAEQEELCRNVIFVAKRHRF